MPSAVRHRLPGTRSAQRMVAGTGGPPTRALSSLPCENGCFFNPCSTYEKFSPFTDTFKKRVSKNTFFVLVRVVDELW